MVSPTTKRRAVRISMENGWGNIAQACRALGMVRSGYYRCAQVGNTAKHLWARIVELSENHPRYGYRRITALLRREGEKVNAKRVQRVRRERGLQTRKHQRRTRRSGCPPPVDNGPNGPITSGVGTLCMTRPSTAAASGS